VLSARIFAYVHPKYATPTRSIYLMGAFAMLGGLFMRFQMAVELLNFGAFVGFILVNLSVIRHYYVRLGRRGGMDGVRHLVAPALGAAVCIYVWMSLSTNAKLVGFLWMGVGLLYLGLLTRGFSARPKPLTFEQEA
jgi:amino acid transporter